MSFYLSEGLIENDVEELQSLQFIAFESPITPISRIFLPVFEQGTQGRSKAINDSAERFIVPQLADSNCYWAKIVEEDSGHTVAAHSWRIPPEDPFTDRLEFGAVWWPEGEAIRCATAWGRRLYEPQRKYMCKSYAGKSRCARDGAFS